MSHSVEIAEVIDGDDFDLIVLELSTEKITANTTKAIDCDARFHGWFD